MLVNNYQNCVYEASKISFVYADDHFINSCILTKTGI